MQIRLFSFFAIWCFAFSGLLAQGIEIDNPCAQESIFFRVVGLDDLPENIFWTIKDDEQTLIDTTVNMQTDTTALEGMIERVTTIEVMAWWELEVEVDSMIVVQRDTLTTSIDIEECDCSVGMPNIFTPDSGAEINQTFGGIFRTPCQDNRYELFQLRIYSRWGELIFDSCEGQSIPCQNPVKWDGTSSSNEPLPPDTYIYALQYQIRDIEGGITNVLEREEGEVVLLR